MNTALKKMFVLVLFAGALSVSVPLGYGHEAHNKNTANTNTSADQSHPVNEAGQPVPTPSSDASGVSTAAHIEEFPTLHPLVVHFPIMLIILAAAFQVVSMLVFRREMGWVVVVMAFLGSVGAYLASNVFHPHTTGLTENAQRLLVEHELFAAYSLWLAASGFVLKSVSQFFLERRWWSEAVVTIVLLGAAVAVAWAGHHGAELVHKEGVGPRGNFLEMHDH
jgi:uncharacterized membrane protein